MGRIVRSADFERVLGTPPAHRTAHFAVHYAPGTVPAELSTSVTTTSEQPVDELHFDTRWFGVVVPKRHARRSVTRSLLKRQMRSVAERHALDLKPGWWVLRLKAPFDPKTFVSAASEPLRQRVHQELDTLFGRLGARSRSRSS